jgi:hypothetical protein
MASFELAELAMFRYSEMVQYVCSTIILELAEWLAPVFEKHPLKKVQRQWRIKIPNIFRQDLISQFFNIPVDSQMD